MSPAPDLTGRVCLITGATSGMGRATARALAGMGASVFVHGRDPARCAETVAALREQTHNPSVEPIVADLASLDAIRGMAAELKERTERLHVLVNNAGGMYPALRDSVDGIEMNFAVNHLASFALTNLLLDQLRASAPARVVNVASVVHRYEGLDFADLQWRRKYDARSAYWRSKTMNVLFTRELARRLDGSGVTVNASGPGLVHTEFGVKDGMGLQYRAILSRGVSPEQGARTTIYLASAPEVESVTGGYFENEAPSQAGDPARDDAAARRLWEESVALAGLPG